MFGLELHKNIEGSILIESANMNFKQRGALFLVLMTAFVLVSIVLDAAENGALAAPGRRGGGGGSRGSSSRGSSSRGSSWFGSSKPKSSSGKFNNSLT